MNPRRKLMNWANIATKLATLAAVGFAIHIAIEWAMAQISKLESDQAALAMFSMMIVALIAYAILMTTPFVPGIELGISLLVLRGAEIAPFIYLSTVCGLLLAYFVGRYMPLIWFSNFLSELGLRRAADLIENLAQRGPDAQESELHARVPTWLRPFITKWRYLTLAALLNIPGNVVLGGGGGIMLASGLSRRFSIPLTALTVALAVAPVPLSVWLLGVEILN